MRGRSLSYWTWLLPESNGMELMNSIQKTADVPLIFLSVYSRDETVARALLMGAADYLVKPFSPTELAARIRATLGKRLGPRDAGRAAGGADVHGVRGALRSGGPRSTHADPQGVAPAGLVRNVVKRLRRKLGNDAADPRYILTKPRVGYWMETGEG